ncbi:MAG: indolepyruvate ferredoxin oxidoreductase subunit alpha [Planctomycetes bacterium]|nr:indolepyruvate ferredoxin oxidoreductase subunit alpha [Planctomycetota bacterium]
MTRDLLSGDEAIARGAFEAGIAVATAYPGTPSTEILETIASGFPSIDAQWSPNEKAALEVGLGASMGGARTLVAMKHVGLNVAADPLFTASYTGVTGALVIVTADDPSLHSSQNEQDNRWYARAAKMVMLEPSDSQEAKDFVLQAAKISERFDTPVLFRITTRIAHSKSIVTLSEPSEPRPVEAFTPRRRKYVMIPAYARRRHVLVEERLQALAGFAEESDLNRIEEGSGDVGIITSGIAYQYVREAFPEVPVLKLGMTFPLPEGLIRRFAASVEKCVVVEELDDILTRDIRAMGIDVAGKAAPFRLGELDVERVRAVVEEVETDTKAAAVKSRPPALCPGCPHRATFYVLKKCKAIVTGDIGCYTLGVLAPLEMMESCVCMGASIGMAFGLRKALSPDEARRVVGVIGDSTFFHSGVEGLIDAVYNGADGVVMILDNRTTAMTGGQGHAGTGDTLSGRAGNEIAIEGICKGIGVSHVVTLDPFETDKLQAEVLAAFDRPGVSVIVAKSPCVLLCHPERVTPARIDADKCKHCGKCLDIGCRAISPQEESPVIDEALCTGCGLCVDVCPFGAIHIENE